MTTSGQSCISTFYLHGWPSSFEITGRRSHFYGLLLRHRVNVHTFIRKTSTSAPRLRVRRWCGDITSGDQLSRDLAWLVNVALSERISICPACSRSLLTPDCCRPRQTARCQSFSHILAVTMITFTARLVTVLYLTNTGRAQDRNQTTGQTGNISS